MSRVPMGLGHLGFNNTTFKRKFRYTFEITELCGGQTVPRHYVKTAARPKLAVEETEINFLNAKGWIPGKASWESISVTYLDVATFDAKPIFDWLCSVYNFSGTSDTRSNQGSSARDYAGTGVLNVLSGCGDLIERWTLRNIWPTSVDFGELDYSSSDICEIQLDLRYSDVVYENNCPGFTIQPCCTPCI